jgi:hypothetical protein
MESGDSAELRKHASWPNNYDAPLSAEAEAAIAAIADVMIPPLAGRPDAGELVPRFVSERISPAERDSIQEFLGEIEGTSRPDLRVWLETLEAARPDCFEALRAWVYYGYYTSGTLIDILHAQAGYHGAPQPVGYKIDHAPRIPMAQRGSYLRTDEVVNVLR